MEDPKTAGYSLVQLIETSSIVAHFSELRRTIYDVAAAAARIRSTDFPFEQLAEMLLEPPGAEASTQYFEDARHE